jgi:TolB-like protein
VVTPAASKPARARLLAGLSGLVALFVLVAFTLGRQETGKNPPEIAAAKTSARRSVAVLGFKNLSSRPEVAWLSTALSEMLSAEIGAATELRSISGENVARARQEMGLPEAETLANDSLGKLRTNLGADLVIVGSYVVIGEGSGSQLRLILNLQDTVSGETVASVSETGTEAQVLAGRRGGASSGTLGAPMTPPCRAAGPVRPARRRAAEGVLKGCRASGLTISTAPAAPSRRP